MKTTVRPITPDDADRVIRMANALSAHEGAPPPALDADGLRRWGFGPRRRFDGVLAERGGRAVGYALFHPSFHVGQGSPGVFLMDLFVEPGARLHGVGRALMEGVRDAARGQQAAWIVWQVHPENVEALAFYRALGARRYRAADYELLVDP